MGRIKLFLLALLSVVLVPTFSHAQSGDRVLEIIAVVGDLVITEYDLEQRNRLIISNAGLPDTAETRAGIRGQILSQLIEESVQIQEAERLNILPPREDAEQAFANVARGNNMTADQLEGQLARQGIDSDTLVNQFQAKLAWNNVIRRQVARTVQVAESEIDLVLSKMETLQNQVQVNLSEIFIAKSDPRRIRETRRLIESLKEQIEAGARFSTIAQQFSQNPSADRSGALGWKLMAELEPSLAQVAEALQPNQISDIIETPAGFYLLLANDRRQFGVASQQTRVDLAQMVFPAIMTDPNSVAAARQQAEQQAQAINTCEAFRSAASALGTPGSGDFGTVSVGSLAETYQSVVSSLPVGQVSAPLEIPAGIALIMVCDRQEPEVQLPTREQIGQNIRVERVSVAARRYLRDLTRDTTIELR